MTATLSPTARASAWSWVTKTAACPGRAQDGGDVLAQPGPQVGVEAGEGLVQQHERRLGSQSTGQGHPLTLAARQLVGVAAGRGGPTPPARASPPPATDRPPAPRTPKPTLRATDQVGEQGVLLEDQADPARLGGQDRPTVVDHLAADGTPCPRRPGAGRPTRRSSVDLPHPLGPTRASSSPSATVEVDARRRPRWTRIASCTSASSRASARRRDGRHHGARRGPCPGQRDSTRTGMTATTMMDEGGQGRLLEAGLGGQVVDPHRQGVEAEGAQQQHDGQLLEGVDADEDGAGQQRGAGQRAGARWRMVRHGEAPSVRADAVTSSDTCCTPGLHRVSRPGPGSARRRRSTAPAANRRRRPRAGRGPTRSSTESTPTTASSTPMATTGPGTA